MFVSIDAWHVAAFDRLADAMLTDLPAPLYTLVAAADPELSGWRWAGFTIRRREWEYLVPTNPQVTGLEVLPAPSGVRIAPAGQVDEGTLRGLDRAIREEVEAGPGWQTMPAKVGPRPEHMTIVDPTRYAFAAEERIDMWPAPIGDGNTAATHRPDRGPGRRAAPRHRPVRCCPRCSGRCTAPGPPLPRPRSTSPTKRPWRSSRASEAAGRAATWE